MELTGKRRYRTFSSWGVRYIVLQVQERGIFVEWSGNGADAEHRTYWRDAQLEDMTEHEKHGS